MAVRLVDRVALALKDELIALGFRKRTGQIYTTELAPDVLGWLGLNSATEHQPKGSVEINPIVGIRHQAVERTVAELRREPFDEASPPTVNTSLGYLMPEQSYRSWILAERAHGDGPHEIAAAIERYGLPFMRRAADLPELVRLIKDGLGYAHQLVYRYPVALWLAGEPRRAQAALRESLVELGTRDDIAAKQLRAFADALSARLAEVRG